jgi:dihydroorotate dehydrogenase
LDYLYSAFKKIAFSIDPEKVHNITLDLLSRHPLLFSLVTDQGPLSSNYQVQVGKLTWPFPVGLAAGLDKNCVALDYFSRTLFGAIEVGTVTPKPQEGNPKPRMFRYPEQESLRNKMGFNNLGANQILENIKSSINHGRILGVNLGKNKITLEEKAFEDYLFLYEKFSPVADYLVINVSSPNTPGLRDLQRSENLRIIFNSLKNVRSLYPKPLYLKISPDLSFEDVGPIIDLVKEFKLEGIIATNTTIMENLGEGGISGKLCFKKSREMRKYILERTKESPEIQVIGVGGISCFADLLDFWKMGGKVVQIYSSLIFQGPHILNNFKMGIDKYMKKTGSKNLEELIKNI